ncbi:MAG: Abi family protein [Enterococcus sp.]|nr:Abi family protein [Enterococcus sp.]
MTKKEHQPALTINEQIENLHHLGLQLDDEFAYMFLNDVSYFRLIKAFSLGLKPKNGNYNSNVTFHQIVELYKFNSNFRQLLFPIIERIEINLRCRIANYFCCKYGVFGYEEASNFADPIYHQEFLNDIHMEISRNKKSPFVRNFLQNYIEPKIPMYALVELFSFGTLSKFFKNMKNDDKKQICLAYHVGYTYFESWIESIAYVRNLCAHYGRLYNAIIPKKPKLYKQYAEAGIVNNRIYAILLCMSLLIVHDEHWEQFLEQLDSLFEKYDSVKLETMGFPQNWKELLK